MLGLAIFGTILLGSAIRCGIDNAQAKSAPFMTYKDGTQVFHDRKGRPFVNGERCCEKYEPDEYGNYHTLLVGIVSGKIYHNSRDDEIERESKWDLRNLEISKEYGNLAYMKYDPTYKQSLTTEISTGRVIAALFEDYDGNYRKFYLKGHPYRPNESAPDDLGIIITKEEYEKLNIIGGSHSKVPNLKVLLKFNKEAEEKAEEKRQKEEQERIEEYRRFGSLSYRKYDPTFKCEVLIEFATGRVIAALYAGNEGYKKWYLKDNAQSLYELGEEVEITEEEYRRLYSFFASFLRISDDDFRNIAHLK